MFENFFLLVAFGTVGFWIMFFVISCLMISFLEFNRSIFATLTFIGTLFLLNATGVSFDGIIQHPIQTAIYVFGYIFLVGPVWAIFKWWRKVENLAQQCRELKYEFLREYRITGDSIPSHLHESWYAMVRCKGTPSGDLHFDSNGLVPPHPSDYKEEIYLWMLFWPWSIVWFIFDEPVRKAIRLVYRSIRGYLVSISEHSFKDIRQDFVPPIKKER